MWVSLMGTWNYSCSLQVLVISAQTGLKPWGVDKIGSKKTSNRKGSSFQTDTEETLNQELGRGVGKGKNSSWSLQSNNSGSKRGIWLRECCFWSHGEAEVWVWVKFQLPLSRMGSGRQWQHVIPLDLVTHIRITSTKRRGRWISTVRNVVLQDGWSDRKMSSKKVVLFCYFPFKKLEKHEYLD